MSTQANTSAMRVLIVLTSNNRRGAEIEGSRLADELCGRGIEAEAVALAGRNAPAQLSVPVLGSKPLAPSTLRALRVRARDCDVVIAYGSSSLPACAIGLFAAGIPFVYRSIGDPTAWARGRAHNWRTRVLLRRAAHVIALWPGAQAGFLSLYGLESGRVSVIPNARSSDEFRPPTAVERANARSALGLAADGMVVGCVGSVSEEKQVDLAIDAVALVPNAQLLVVGDGPLRTRLERHAREALGERATFTGTVDDVTPAYDAIDVLLVPSRTEGMPGVVLEASMSGVPVLASEVGAIPWMFSEGVSGTLIPVTAQADEWAESIMRLGSASRALQPYIPSRCTWPEVTEDWVALLQTVVGERPCSATPEPIDVRSSSDA